MVQQEPVHERRQQSNLLLPFKAVTLQLLPILNMDSNIVMGRPASFDFMASRDMGFHSDFRIQPKS